MSVSHHTAKLVVLAVLPACSVYGQNAQGTTLELFCSIAENSSICQAIKTFNSTASGGGANGLSIGNFQPLGEQRLTQTKQFVTFAADLMNAAAAIPEATATVSSRSLGVTIVPGQATLHFPPLQAHGSVTSRDTFTILIDNTVPFSFSDLQWSFFNPVSNPGFSRTVSVGRKVTLDGSGSSNPTGGGILAFLWSFGPIPAGSNAVLSDPASVMPSFTADVPGDYVVTLTVSNEAAKSSARVTISTKKSEPVAIAGPNRTAAVGTEVTLDGSGSFNADGSPITYSWSLISAPIGSHARLTNAESVFPTFVPDTAGNYIVQLAVNNEHLSCSLSTMIITTLNTPPVANAGPDQHVITGSPVQLTGSGSTDVDGDRLAYKWRLISVPANSNASINDPKDVNPVFTVDVPGVYVAQLVVNDGIFDSAPATTIITTDTFLPPTANAGPNQKALPVTTVTLTGSGSDPESLPLTRNWSLISKPAASLAVLSSKERPKPTFRIDVQGTYIAQLIVSNSSMSSM